MNEDKINKSIKGLMGILVLFIVVVVVGSILIK